MAKKQKGQGGAKASGQPERKLVATHRRARFEYEILETFEAGIVLSGPEVKSLRDGGASLAEAFAMVRRGLVPTVPTVLFGGAWAFASALGGVG